MIQSFLSSIKISSRQTKLSFAVGVAVTAFFLFLIFFDFTIRPFDPQQRFPGFVNAFPTAIHLFGTDVLGRDVLSRVLAGAKYSILIAALAVTESMVAGTTLGAISGYFGGKVDRVLLLFVDALYSFPAFIMALLIVVMLGGGIENTAGAVAIPLLAQFFRIVRSITLEVKERTFIDAEKGLGASSSFILWHHVSPSYISALLVLVSLTAARSIVTVSSLGFLGLGVQPPTPEWGTEMAQARVFIPDGIWWTTFFPGMFIFLAVIGFSQLAESLNEILRAEERMRKIL